jgi:hypothetical protein
MENEKTVKHINYVKKFGVDAEIFEKKLYKKIKEDM